MFCVEPYTEYKIFVKAFTRKHDGNPSETVTNKTDIAGPSAPRILNLTCQKSDMIFVHWERPRTISYSLDFYYIYVSTDGNTWDTIELPTSKEHLDTSVSNHDLV